MNILTTRLNSTQLTRGVELNRVGSWYFTGLKSSSSSSLSSSS